MSKMGQELERKLDENKYDMYEALVFTKNQINEYLNPPEYRISSKAFLIDALDEINRALAKIEGGVDAISKGNS